MTAESLEILNLRRQIEKQNLILRYLLEEMRRLNRNYEMANGLCFEEGGDEE